MSYNWATNKKVIILGAFSGGTAATKPVPHPRGSDQLALPYTVEGKGLRNPHAKFDTFFINVTIVVKFDMILYRYEFKSCWQSPVFKTFSFACFVLISDA